MNERYERLLIIEDMPSIKSGGQFRKFVKCKCDCGKEIVTLLQNLKSGCTKSCGCLRSEKSRKRMTKHNKCDLPEYDVWRAMKQRCNNSNNKFYYLYGGRGIKICKEWDDFECFIANMGLRPEGGYSLDRIDNDGNYEPSNCRWATSLEQAKNNRWSYIFNYNGSDYTLRQLAIFLDINYGKLRHILLTKPRRLV